jgi:hypothetical protein
VSSRPSSRVSSVMLLPILSTPSARLSPPSMSSMPSSARAAPFTVLVVKPPSSLHATTLIPSRHFGSINAFSYRSSVVIQFALSIRTYTAFDSLPSFRCGIDSLASCLREGRASRLSISLPTFDIGNSLNRVRHVPFPILDTQILISTTSTL